MTTPLDRIERLRALTADVTSSTITVSVAAATSAPVTEATVNRIGGPPIGITDATWPRSPMVEKMFKKLHGKKKPFHGDDRMEHVFTLDLRAAPHIGLPAEAHALALFVSNRRYNEAWRDTNQHIAVVLLGAQHLALGPYTGALPGGVSEECEGFELIDLKIPISTFDAGASGALREALFNVDAYFGGYPIWLQSDPYEDGGYDDIDDDEQPREPSCYTLQGRGQGAPAPPPLRLASDFVGQCNERFGGMNLGDSGELYIYGDRAFAQGY